MLPSTVPLGRLVVASHDRKTQRALQRVVGATLCPVEIVSDAPALVRACDDTTIAVVDASVAQAHPEVRETAKPRSWIAVPGDGGLPLDPTMVSSLLTAGWNHVIAHPMPLLAEELLATVQKLIRRDVFGLEKYVTWGATVRSYTLEDVRDREVAVAEVAKDVVAVGLPDRVGSLVSVIVDELVANALFVAPVDAAGARIHVHDPRDTSRSLTGRDVVTVRWATDGRYLAIEVRDSWGSIDAAAVGTRLANAGKQAGVDGGMGLPLTYACCNQFVINCKPTEVTEVIALLDIRYKPTELGRSASFHAFNA